MRSVLLIQETPSEKMELTVTRYLGLKDYKTKKERTFSMCSVERF